MPTINLLAIAMVLGGAGAVHLIGACLWKDSPAKTYILVGMVILALDITWRARKHAETPRNKWLGTASGVAISIFPVRVLGLFGILYEALRLNGFTL